MNVGTSSSITSTPIVKREMYFRERSMDGREGPDNQPRPLMMSVVDACRCYREGWARASQHMSLWCTERNEQYSISNYS